MASNRIDRISEEVMRSLSSLIRTVKDPRISGGLLSIVRCEVSGDLRWCKVFISVLGDYNEKELMRGLKSASGYLRRELAHELSLRYTPELVFILDDSITVGAHINQIIHNLPKPKEELPHDDQ
ncbi:30S ribosome-binding factor RbfA [Acidaminobacterium chupaoyuni]